MTIKKTDRQQLLQNAHKLFRKKGYENTSIADIAEACDLSKGSVYHYIDSKKELAIEILKQQQQYYTNELFNIAYNDALPARERLKMFTDKVQYIYQAQQGRCIMVQLALESAEVLPEFKQFCRSFFTQWLDAIAYILLALGKMKEDAHKQAQSIVSEIQGAMLLSLAFADNTILLQAIKRLQGVL